MRNANKEACCHCGENIDPEKRFKDDNAASAPTIHSNGVYMAAVTAQFRDSSLGASDAPRPQVEIALRLQLRQARQPGRNEAC
jgi:hypothetical protein